MQRRNTVIFALILLAALLLALGVQRFFTRPGGMAVVQVDGKTVAKLPLWEDTERVIGGKKGGYNRVKIADGRVSVTDADCPDQICVRTGAIDSQGQVIACLPHKLIITVEGAP